MRRLVLFDLDGTLVDHESAAAEGVEQWLIGNGWAEAASIAGLVRDWDAIAERQFRAYRKRRTSSRGPAAGVAAPHRSTPPAGRTSAWTTPSRRISLLTKAPGFVPRCRA